MEKGPCNWWTGVGKDENQNTGVFKNDQKVVLVKII